MLLGEFVGAFRVFFFEDAPLQFQDAQHAQNPQRPQVARVESREIEGCDREQIHETVETENEGELARGGHDAQHVFEREDRDDDNLPDLKHQCCPCGQTGKGL